MDFFEHTTCLNCAPGSLKYGHNKSHDSQNDSRGKGQKQ